MLNLRLQGPAKLLRQAGILTSVTISTSHWWFGLYPAICG